MSKLFKRLLPDLWVALGLLLLPLLLFAPVTAGNLTLLPADNLVATEPWRSAAAQFGAATAPVPHNKLLDDLVLENYPWRKFLLESLHARQLPLWNPYQFAGLPFLAAGQSSALYPFTAIFYIVPLARAYGLYIVSQFFMAGLLAYIFLRVLGLRRLSAVFGAIVYELNLFMVVSVVFPMIVAGAAWLPLVLTAIELAVRQQPALGGRPATMPWVALGSAAIGLQILAGHVEITYYTLMVAGAYSAWRLGGESLRRRRALGLLGAARRLAGRSLGLLALAGLGVALGAVQLIPLLEVVRHNFRSGSASFNQIIGWAYPWRHVLAFLVPNVFGNPSHHAYFDLFTWSWTAASVNAKGEAIDNIFWGVKNYVEGGAYVGLLPLLLVAIAFVSWVRRLRRGRPNDGRRALPLGFFFVLGFLALCFAFPTRLYVLIFWLPGINQLHSPFRWVWPLSLCVAVLSAAGIEALREPGGPARAWRGPLASVVRIFCLWSEPTLVTALAGAAAWGGVLAVLALAAARAGYDALGVARLMDRLVLRLALANQAFANGRMFFSYEAPWLLAFALLLIACGLVLRASRSKIAWRGRPAWQFLALGVLVVDLSAAGWGFNPSANPRILTYTPPAVDFLRQDQSLWRFTTFDTQGAKPFNANQGWYFDFYDVRGYDSIFSQQYKRYMELIQPQTELDFNRIAPISDAAALNSPLLDLLNVKYLISLEQIENPKYQLVYSAEVKIYENTTSLPRAFLLPQTATLVTADFGQAVQSYDPRKFVIVEQTGAKPLVATPPAAAPTGVWPSPVDDIQYSPNEVSVTASPFEPAWLVLADSYFPGWKAYVRPAGSGAEAEKPLTIQLVDGNFRGVQLPAGSWTIRFKYSPDSIKFGGIVSLIAGVSLVFGMGVFAWRYFYQESAVDSTARRVAKNSLAPLALNLFNRAIDFAFAALMLRVLGPDDAGKYYYAIVIFGWFDIITNYGLNALLIRDVARDREHANRYLVNTTVLRLALGVVAIPVLAALLVLRQILPPVALPFGLGAFQPDRLSPETLWAIALLVLAAAPGTVATGLSALFTAYEKAEYPAAVASLTTLVKVSLGTIALLLGLGFVGLAGISIVVNGVTLAVLGILAWRQFFRPRLEFDLGFQRHAVRESFPLMLNNLLATLFFKVDVTLLEPIQGTTQVGWYSAGYKFIDAFNLVPSLFTFALFPVMARQAHDDKTALRRSYTLAIKLLVGVALPLALATTAAAPLMVGILGGSAFLPYGATALAILVWSIPFGWINSVTNYVLIALGQQRGLTRAFAVSLVFNITLNLLLLPRFGFQAAAAITIASELFEGALFYVYLRRSLGALPWPVALWRLWVSGAAMIGVTLLLWRFSPSVASVAGLVVYSLGLLVLRPFSAEEETLLAGILPARLRRALRMRPDESLRI
jgi:O-antigen/teichoic acid export membrane protein